MHSTPFSPLSTEEANTELAFELYDTHADLATAADFKLLIQFCNTTPRGLLLTEKMLSSEAFLLQQHSKKQSPLIDYFPELQGLLKTSIPALSAAIDLLRQAKESEDILRQAISYVIDEKWTVANCEEMNTFFSKIARAETCQAWAEEFIAISDQLSKRTRCKLFKSMLNSFGELNADSIAFETLFEAQLVENVFDDDMDVFERVLQILRKSHISRGFAFDKLILVMNQLAGYLSQFENTSVGTFNIIFEIYCLFMQIVNSRAAELPKKSYFYFVGIAIDYLQQIAKNPSKFDFELFYETFFAEIQLFDNFEIALLAKQLQTLILRVLDTLHEQLKMIRANDQDYSAQLFCNTSTSIFEFYQQIFNAKYSVFIAEFYKEEQLSKIQELMEIVFEPEFFDRLFKRINDVDTYINEFYTSSKFTQMMQDIRLENRVDLQTQSFEVRCWVSLLDIYEQGCMYHFESNALIPLFRSCFSNHSNGCLFKLMEYLQEYLLTMIADGTSRDTFLEQELVNRLPLPDLTFGSRDCIFAPTTSFVNSIFLSLLHSLCNEPDNQLSVLLSDEASVQYLFFIFVFSFYFKALDCGANRHILARYEMHMPILFAVFARQSDEVEARLGFLDNLLLQLLDEDIDVAIAEANAKSACERIDFSKEDETYCWRTNNLSIDRVTNLIHYENKPEQFCDILEDLVNQQALPCYSVEALVAALVSFPWGPMSRERAAARFFNILPTCLLSRNLVLVAFCLSILTQPNIVGAQIDFLQQKLADHDFLMLHCEDELPTLKAILNDFALQGSRYMEDLTSEQYKLQYEIMQQTQAQAAPGQLHEQQKPQKVEQFDLMPCVQVIRGRLEDFVLPVCVLSAEYQNYDLLTLLDAVPILSNYQYLAQNAPVTSAEYYSQEYLKGTPFEQTYIYLQHSHFLSPHAMAEYAIELIGKFGALFDGIDIITDGMHTVNYIELRLPFFHPIENPDGEAPGQTVQSFEDTKPVHELRVHIGEAVKETAVWMARQPFIYAKFIDKLLDDDRSAVISDCEELMIMFLNGAPDDKKFNKSANEAVYDFCYLLSVLYLNGYREFNMSMKERKRNQAFTEPCNDVELIELIKEVLLNKDNKYAELKGLLVQNLTKIAMGIQEDRELPIAASIRECAQMLLFDLIGYCLESQQISIVAIFVMQLVQVAGLNNLVSSAFLTILQMIVNLFKNLKPELCKLLVEQIEQADAEFITAIIAGHEFSDTSYYIRPLQLEAVFRSLYIFNCYFNSKSAVSSTPKQDSMSGTALLLYLKTLSYGNEFSKDMFKELSVFSLENQHTILLYTLLDNVSCGSTKQLLDEQDLAEAYLTLREAASGRIFNELLTAPLDELPACFFTARRAQARATRICCMLCHSGMLEIPSDGLSQSLFSFCDCNFYRAFSRRIFANMGCDDVLEFPTLATSENAFLQVLFDERRLLAGFARREIYAASFKLPMMEVQKWREAYESKYFGEKLPVYFEIACWAALECADVKGGVPLSFLGERSGEISLCDEIELLTESENEVCGGAIEELMESNTCAFAGIHNRAVTLKLVERAAAQGMEADSAALRALFVCSYVAEAPIFGFISMLRRIADADAQVDCELAASALLSMANYKLDTELYYQVIQCVTKLFQRAPLIYQCLPKSLLVEMTQSYSHLNSAESINCNIVADMILCEIYGTTFFGNFKGLSAATVSKVEGMLAEQEYSSQRQRELMYAQYYVYNVVNCHISYSRASENCNIIDRLLLALSCESDEGGASCYSIVLGILENGAPKDYQQFKEDLETAEDLPDLELLLIVLQILYIRGALATDLEAFEQFVEFIITLIILQTAHYMQLGRYNQAQHITRDILRLICRLLEQNQQLAQVKFGRYLFDYLSLAALYFLGICNDFVLSPYYQLSDNSQETLTLSEHESKLPKDGLCAYIGSIKAHKFDAALYREIKELIVYAIFLFVSYLANEQRELQQSLYQDYLLLVIALYDETQGRPYYNTVSKLSEAVAQLQEMQSLVIPFAVVSAGTQQFIIDQQHSVAQPELLRLKIEISVFSYIERITDHTQLTVQAIELFSKLITHLKDSAICIVPFVEKWDFKDEYILLELSKQDGDATPAFEYYKQYCLTLAFSQFVEAAKQIHLSLNKIYALSLLLQDYYAQDVNVIKETQPGACLYLSFLNKTDSYEKQAYPLQQQEEAAEKIILEEISQFGKSVLSFEQAIYIMIQQSSEEYFREAISVIHFAYFLIFTAPKPLVDVTKVINQKTDLYASMFYKMHHSLAKLLLMHYNALTQNESIAQFASFDIEEVAKNALSSVQECIQQHQPPPYLRDEFDERMHFFSQRFEQLTMVEVPITQIEIKYFDNGIFKLQTAKLFGKIDIQPEVFFQQSYDALMFKQQFPYYCIQNSALLTLELIRIAGHLKQEVFKKVVSVSERLYCVPLSSISFYKHDKRCDFENKIDAMCVGDKQNCIFLGLNINVKISEKAVDYLVSELYMKIYEQYYKQVVLQPQGEQTQFKYQPMWPRIITDQIPSAYFSQFSSIKGVNQIYQLVEMMHNVELPGIKQYPHQYSQSRFSYIQLFVLELLRLSAQWSDKFEENEYGYTHGQLQRIFFRIVNLSSDFSSLLYGNLMQNIFNFDTMRTNAQKPTELVGCTHDLSMHYFYARNQPVASIQRLMIQLLLLLPLNSTLLRNNLSNVLLRTLNACYTFPMDIHTLLLLSETFEQQPFHSELTKLNQIVVNYVHANTKRDASKKYSFRVSHHEPAISPLHQAHFEGAFDNSGYDCLNFLEKLFAAGIPHFDSTRGGENLGEKRLQQQKEELGELIDMLFKCQQLLSACGAQIAQIDQNQVLLINEFRAKNTATYADFFTAEAIAAGSLTALSYECAAFAAIHLTLLFETVLQKMNIRGSIAPGGQPALQALDEYRKIDADKEKLIQINKQAVEDLLRQRDAVEKQVLELEHSRDNTAKQMQQAGAKDPQSEAYEQLREKFIDLDARLSEVARRQAQFKPSQQQLQDQRDQLNEEKFENIITLIDKLQEIMQVQAQAEQPEAQQVLELCQSFKRLRESVEEYFKFDSDEQIVTTSLISTEKIGQRILSQMYDDLGAADVAFGVNYPVQYKFTLSGELFAFSWFTNKRLFELNAHFRHNSAAREKNFSQFKRYMLSCDEGEFPASNGRPVMIRNRPTLFFFGFQADMMMYQFQHNLYKAEPAYDYWQQQFEHVTGLYIDSLSHLSQAKPKEKAPAVKDVNAQMNEQLKKNLRSQFKQIIGRVSESQDRNQFVYQLFLKQLNIFSQDQNSPNIKLDTYRTQLVLYEKDCFGVQQVHTQLANLLESQNYADLDNLSQELREEYLKKTTANDKQHTAFVNQTELYEKLYDFLTRFAREIRQETPEIDFNSLIQEICSQKLENRPDALIEAPPPDANLIQLNNLNQYFQCQTIALINSIVPGPVSELFNLHQNGTAIFSSVLNIIASDQKEQLYSSSELDFELTFDCTLMRKIVEAYAIFAALYPEIALETIFKEGILRRGVGETIVRAREIQVGERNRLNCGDIQIYEILIFFLIQRFTPSSIAPGPSVLFFEGDSATSLQNTQNVENSAQPQSQLKQEIIKDLEYINYDDYKAKYQEIAAYVLETLKSAIHQDVDKALVPELEYTYQCDAALLSYQPQIILHLLCFAALAPVENRAILRRFALLMRDFVIQAYGRSTKRQLGVELIEYADVCRLEAIFAQIQALATEFIMQNNGKLDEEIDSQLQATSKRIYSLVHTFLLEKRYKSAELRSTPRDLSTYAYTRLLILNGVQAILAPPFPYLGGNAADADDEPSSTRNNSEALAARLWGLVRAKIEPIRFQTVTNLASRMLWGAGDPISAYKLSQDELVRAYIAGSVFCADEQPRQPNARRIALHQLEMMERIRTIVISLITAGSLSVARQQLQSLDEATRGGVLILNDHVRCEMRFLQASIYEIFADIGELEHAFKGQEIISEAMKCLTSGASTTRETPLVLERHYYACVTAFEGSIDNCIREAQEKPHASTEEAHTGQIFDKEQLSDLLQLTANVINALLNMITFPALIPANDTEKEFLLQTFEDLNSPAALDAFEKILLYLITPPTYMLEPLEDAEVLARMDALGIPRGYNMCSAFAEYISTNCGGIQTALIARSRERLIIELLKNHQRYALHTKFLIIALFKRAFSTSNACDFEYREHYYSLSGDDENMAHSLYLFVKASCEIPINLSVSQFVQVLFENKEPNAAELSQISFLDEVSSALRAPSRDQTFCALCDVHGLFANVFRESRSLNGIVKECENILKSCSSTLPFMLIGYYLALFALYDADKFDTTAIATQNLLASISPGPAPWTIAIVGYLIEKYQSGERPIQAQQQDYENLLLNLVDHKEIYDLAARLEGKSILDALKELQTLLCEGLKEFNKSVTENQLYAVVDKQTSRCAGIIKTNTPRMQISEVCEEEKYPAGVLAEKQMMDSPYFDTDACPRFWKSRKGEQPLKLNFTSIRIIFIDGLPFIQTKVIPGGQTVLLFNASAKSPLLTYAREVLPDFSNLRTAFVERFWADKSNVATYETIYFGECCYAFLFEARAEFSLIERLNNQQFNYDFERIYKFKRALCRELAAFMLLAEEYFCGGYNVAQLSVDINSGLVFPFILPLKSLAQENDFQAAAVHSFYLYDALTNHAAEPLNSMLHERYAAHRRPRVSLPKEFIAFAQPHFVLGVLSAEAAAYGRARAVRALNVHCYPHCCISLDLAEVAPQNMSVDVLGLMQTQMFLDEAALCALENEQCTRDAAGQMCHMRCAESQAIVQGIEAEEAKRKIKATNIDSLAEQCSQMKTAMPTVVEWVVACIAAEYD